MPDDVPGTEDNTTQNNDGGSDTPEWLQSISEDLRANPTLIKFSDVEGLAKSYINAQNLIGRDKIPMPESEDDWNGVFDRLGRPGTGDEYNLARPELPEGMQMNEEVSKAFRDTAHQLGLSDKQAAGLFDWYWKNTTAQHADMQKKGELAREEATVALRTEYGEAFERKVVAGERALDEFGSEELIEHLKETGLNNDPRMIRFLANVGEKMMEDGGLKGTGTGSGAQTPEEIQDEINTLMAKPAYVNKKDPEHESLTRQAYNLRKRLHPQKTPVTG